MKQHFLTLARKGFFKAVTPSLLAPILLAGSSSDAYLVRGQNSISSADKQAISSFESRVKNYVKLRNEVKDKLPKLSKDSTPEQIQAFRKQFEAALQAARTGAKRGNLFTAPVSSYFDRTLRNEFKGKDRAQLREIVFEAENEGIPLRVNYPYPPSAELTEMPATLLLKLPQLPKEVRYRFVGRNLLLVDRDSNLILDYMIGALP